MLVDSTSTTSRMSESMISFIEASNLSTRSMNSITEAARYSLLIVFLVEMSFLRLISLTDFLLVFDKIYCLVSADFMLILFNRSVIGFGNELSHITIQVEHNEVAWKRGNNTDLIVQILKYRYRVES